MATRTELAATLREKYQRGTKADRSSILDEFVDVTGYAIRVLSSKSAQPTLRVRRVPRRYGAEVHNASITLWETSTRLCSKRLKPLIPVPLPALEPHSKLAINDALQARLMQISPASMDRLLSEVRLVARTGQRSQSSSISVAVTIEYPVQALE